MASETEETPQDGEVESDVNVMLINLVQEYPFIYDADDPQYKDRYLIEGTWSVIASQVNLTIEEAKTKWQRLRNNFSKACNRRVKTPLNRSAATKLQKPWIYEAEMEFMRSHLHHHKTPSFSMKRRAQEVEGLNSMSPQSGGSDASDSEQISEAALMSDNFSPWSVIKRESYHETSRSQSQSPKTKNKHDSNSNEGDSATPSFRKESLSKSKREEDPAVGWFKSLLPMFNTLSPIEKLEFQSKVTLELRRFLMARDGKEEETADEDQST